MIYGVRKTTSTGRKRRKEEIIDSYYQNFKVKCPCSHTIFIPYGVDKEHPRVEFRVLNKPEALLKTGTRCSNNEEVAEFQTLNFLALLEQRK